MWIHDACVETEKSFFFKLMTTHRQVKMVMLLIYRNWRKGKEMEWLRNILNVNIDKYEQRQCNQLAGTIPIQCGSVGRKLPLYFSSHHWFSLRTCGTRGIHLNYLEHRDSFLTGKWLDGWMDGWNNYLGFFLLCEIIFDVESLPDLLRGFAFNHVGHRLAGDI